jgi:hypothetical protein
MIRYSLACKDGHAFEAWFPSAAAYDKQVKRGLVSCAHCGSTQVEKSIMAPNVSSRTRRKGVAEPAAPVATAPEPAAATRLATAPSPEQAEMLSTLRRLREEVVAKSEYVGPRFAEEARKIHYGEEPARGIYGEASGDDVKALHEEGVACYPLPELPEDKN